MAKDSRPTNAPQAHTPDSNYNFGRSGPNPWESLSAFPCPKKAFVKSTPPDEKKTCGKMSFQVTKSGAGEQFPLKDCRTTARLKDAFF
jgi:hypothetical protein